jgi:predicted dithiol-disulfide oxidoreductase (DUF899 family)
MQHPIVTREKWIAARKELLEAEKELTRRSDELARRRQELPWVRIDKGYRFETDEGTASLADLFCGRSQLLVYHFMFGPEYKAGCPSCSAIADGFNGFAVHLANHDVMLWAVSRAPLAQLQAYKRRMKWTFPWASSADSEFNFDFGVSFTEDEQRQGIEYNYRREPAWQLRGGERHIAEIPSRSTPDGPSTFAAMSGTDTATYTRERPGTSAFVFENGVVYHTYSTYARGLDGLWGMYQWLDRAPEGRNESGVWWRRHDEYDSLPKRPSPAATQQRRACEPARNRPTKQSHRPTRSNHTKRHFCSRIQPFGSLWRHVLKRWMASERPVRVDRLPRITMALIHSR